jgi:hypothetical protein
MSNRSSTLALAALAAFGSTALASTGASAMRPTGAASVATVNTAVGTNHLTPVLNHIPPVGGGGGAGKFAFRNAGLINHFNPTLSPAIKVKKPIDIDCVSFKGCDHDHDHDHPWWFVNWHHPRYGVVEYSTDSTPVSASVGTTQAAAPCNCLTKRSLDDGSVLFRDLCTKEQAMATPDELKAKAQGVAP